MIDHNQKYLKEENISSDPYALAKHFGIGIQKTLLALDQSGYLEYDPFCGSSSHFKIVVNSTQNESRQRWTIAHEIGHFVLHREDPDFKPIKQIMHRQEDYFDYLDGGVHYNREREADKYARDFLLPEKLVVELVNSTNKPSRELARMFGVSIGAFTCRLKELNLQRPEKKRGWENTDPYGMLMYA